MPSAGFIPFVQNFICTFNNTCHNSVWTEPGRIQQYNKSLWVLEKKKQSTREYFILFSVTKLVGDLENSLAENFDSKEKIEALENVIQDFLLLRKLSAKFQSNQASLLENGR